VTTLGGTPAFPSYTVVVTDGSIRFEAQDNGGDSETAAITSLTITALDEAAGIPDDVQAGPVATSPLIIVETHGRVSPPKKNGGLLGTIVSRAAGEAVSKQIGGEEGEFIGGIVEDAVKSAFPSEGRPPVPDWVYELPRAVARSVRREGLGTLNPNVRPIPLPKIEKASGDAELLALQRGSRDFIAVNWSIESSFGTPQEIGEVLDDTSDIYSERQHRASVTRAALATFRMLEARIRQELQKNPQAKVDLLIVGHSFGTSVNRDVVRMLNTSGLAEHLDFVKVVELDPVAMKADANPAERADSHDRYFWSHPEIARNGRPIVDSVVNYYQTEGLAFTGVIEKGLILGKPLDGMDGGGMLGFRNGHAMVFSPLSGETLDQFRLTSGKSGRPSDGDLRNGVFSDDGRLLAVASEDGTVSIRDAVSHREIRRMVISKRAVTDVQFMPGSAEIVTVSKDGLIRVLRVADGVEVWNGLHKGKPVVKPDGDKVYKGAKTVAIRGDGRLLATAGSAGKIRIWKQGRDVYRLAQTIELTDKVRKVAFSPDGRQLAVAAGQSVSLWMFSANGVLLRTREFRDHVSDAHALAFNADGSRLATGGSDRTIFIYDVASGPAAVRTTAKCPMPISISSFDPRTMGFSRCGTNPEPAVTAIFWRPT
jgi:WD40 repeat protein